MTKSYSASKKLIRVLHFQGILRKYGQSRKVNHIWEWIWEELKFGIRQEAEHATEISFL